MKRSPLKRKTSLRSSTGLKARSGKKRRNRMYGKDLEQLRRDCFERDHYQCQALKTYEMPYGGTLDLRCGVNVTWETGHMAHIRAKRRNGDSLDNVRTLCADCHRLEHAYGPSGVKPVPAKETKTCIEGE